MKLAEALILRKDIQNRIEQLRERLAANALVQEGESPAEKPEKLLAELAESSAELEKLISAINLTNASTLCKGETLTALLARRESLTLKLSVLRSFLSAASSTVMRGSHREVKILSTVSVPELRKQADDLSADLRKLDTEIQSMNWTVEI